MGSNCAYDTEQRSRKLYNRQTHVSRNVRKVISNNGGTYSRPIMVTYAENARIVNVAPYLPHLNSDLTVIVILNIVIICIAMSVGVVGR